MSVKDAIKNVFDSLPDDVDWEEAQYRLFLGKLTERSSEATRRELSQEDIREIIETQDEQAYQKYVCESIEEGLRELDAGLGIPHEEATEIMNSWFK